MKIFNSITTLLLLPFLLMVNSGPVLAQWSKDKEAESKLKTKNTLDFHTKANVKERATRSNPKDACRRSLTKERIPVYPQQGRKALNADKATITLVVEKVWDDGSGYRMLLDADHNTFGTLIPETSFAIPTTTDFTQFEYNIPTGTEINDVLVAGQQASIEIEPGTYDFCIANPTGTGKTIWIPNGEMARQDDMEFKAGAEYVFTIKAEGSKDLCVLDVVCDYNIALTGIVSPATGTDLGADEEVTVKMLNKGTKTINSLRLSYSLDKAPAITEEASINLEPNAETTYTFKTKVDLTEEKEYSISIQAELEQDLDPFNNTIGHDFWHISPVELPFSCNFDDESSMDEWVIIDANEDESSWEWCDDSYSSEPDGSGSATIATDELSEEKPEYMMTRRPVSLKAGKHYFTYFYHVDDMGSDEHISILYGKTANVNEMEVLADRPSVTDDSWVRDVINFNVEEEGNYYFAFAAHIGDDAWLFFIDNIEIAEGVFDGKPNLKVEQALVPVSACGLGNEQIGMKISNIGQGDVSKFSISYSIDGGEKIIDTLEEKIAVNQTKDVFFTREVDLSTPDKQYHIAMEVTVIPQEDESAEDSLKDNSVETKVMHYTPAELPFSSKFNVEEERLNWDDGIDGSWYFDTISSYYWNLSMSPLYSRCVNLEADKDYRFTMNYGAGDIVWILELTENFAVVYGKTGTDISTWDTILYFHEEYTEGEVVEEFATFQPTEDGSYTFAIYPSTCNKTLYLKDIKVSEISEYDIAMMNFEALPRMVPVEHANSTFHSSVVVTNMGLNKVDKAKVSVKLGEQVVGSHEFTVGEPDTTVTANIETTVSGAKINDEITLKAIAEIVGQTDANPDNELSKTSLVTDDILAYDRVTEEMCKNPSFTIGSEKYLSCGVLMQVNITDTLTGMAAMWAETETSSQSDIHIYRYDMENVKLGELVFTHPIEKGTEAGEKRYEIPALILEKGYYMMCIGVQGHTLTVDRDHDGILYVVSNGNATAQTGIGTAGIRAIFGHNGIVKTKDAAVAEIAKPAAQGIFAENEPVLVKLQNNGSEKVEVPVHVSINGTELESKTVEISGYGKAEVEFTANLSTPGSEYEIVAWTQLEGDENTANDTLRKTVKCLEPADPYVMNFEYCTDFAIDGFTPAWKSIDKDGNSSYVFKDVSFPHAGKAFGFMAFNPALTNPAMTAEEVPEIQPYEGSRLGIAISSAEGANNDWLVSPQLELPATNAHVSFFVKTFNDEYGLESYKVLVSPTENLDDFEEVHSGEAAANAWKEVKVDMSDYAGKSVYIAIQCVSNDKFIFMVDNIEVSKPKVSNQSTLTSQINLYPNPASNKIIIHSSDAMIQNVNILNLSGKEIYSSGCMNSHSYVYNVEGLGSGIYFARIRTNQGIAVLKFIVK